MLKAIVFDFDGVIANSEPLHFQAYRDVLAEESIVLAERDYYDRYLGFDDVGAFRAIGNDAASPMSDARVADLVARKAIRLEALEHERSILFPGAAAAIARMAAALPVAIASGARGDEIRRVLERERLAHFFTAVVAAEDTPLSKPAPDPYLRAVALLGAAGNPSLRAAECVAIEDSVWGLQSARAAGLKTVGITHTYDARSLVGAGIVIDALDALDLRSLSALCSD
jgi:HAD superfamily hydrolase (TIGR01509 family)